MCCYFNSLFHTDRWITKWSLDGVQVEYSVEQTIFCIRLQPDEQWNKFLNLQDAVSDLYGDGNQWYLSPITMLIISNLLENNGVTVAEYSKATKFSIIWYSSVDAIRQTKYFRLAISNIRIAAK